MSEKILAHDKHSSYTQLEHTILQLVFGLLQWNVLCFLSGKKSKVEFFFRFYFISFIFLEFEQNNCRQLFRFRYEKWQHVHNRHYSTATFISECWISIFSHFQQQVKLKYSTWFDAASSKKHLQYTYTSYLFSFIHSSSCDTFPFPWN